MRNERMNHKLTRTFDRYYKLDSSKVIRTYPSGVSYEGSWKEKKRSGVFRWPNGACYDGEFVENKRHGEGKQEWPDGSAYVGEFQNDVREGYGRHTWFNGEIYEGTFLRDKRHGKGIYYWPNGTQYEGHFCNDLKEGYGCFHFPDGKRFEGMYKNNERNGAGIFSYCDGRQDVGIWLGEKLIRLCTVMENTFVFQHFSDYFVNAGENVPSKVRRANSALADSRSINKVEETKQTFGSVDKHKSNNQIPETFPLADIMVGVRNSCHGPKGPCELASEEFLHISGKGDCMRVMELIEEGLVHVDVADKTGFTALLAASVNCHKDTINCLLDYGADVNKLNYEGLSPLAACHVLFYTKHTWKENIGEILAKENIFNSVYWDAQSGTFVQRKHVYYQNKTRSKINVTEDISQSSTNNSVNGSNMNNLTGGKPKTVGENSTDSNICSGVHDIAFETEENDKNPSTTDNENVPCKVKEHPTGCGFDASNSDRNDRIPYETQALHLKCCGMGEISNEIGKKINNVETRKSITKEDVPNDQQDVTTNYNNKYYPENQFTEPKVENNEAGSLDIGNAQSEVEQSNRFNIKESIGKCSEMVDKNKFIHVFLNRAASARSKQNSSISFENTNSSYEESYSDDRDKVNYYQDENSRCLTGDHSKDLDEREDNHPVVTVTAPDRRESIPSSVQNAISSSLQTTNTVEDADSLKSVKQNRQKLLTQQRRPHLEATVRLLLRRGANPNASSLPMPVLFFAIKAADAPAVKLLLEKGADTNARLSKEKLGITPLHIAVALPSDAISISKLLLEAGADPNLRDFAFGDLDGGRTPLHTACCREDNDEDANRVIRLLLDYKADPNLLCTGHSSLSLVIGSGNDLAVETLLKGKADSSLSLTHGVGSPLCAAVSFTAEKRRKIVDHVRLVNKLIRSGANILAPIIVSHKHPPGTVVDYAYNVFYQDRRIAHTPYHSLTPYEREIYIARRKMLDHLAELLRTHVLKKEKKLLEEQLSRAKELQEESSEEIHEQNLDRAVSFYFDETQSISELSSTLEKASIYDESHETVSCFSLSDSRFPDCGLRVAVVQTPSDHMNVSRLSLNSTKKRQLIRKNRFRYCYECGRSVAVRLAPCTRCKEVFYCSRSCKLKAWNSRHREECIRLSARNKSSLSRRTDSPTSITNTHKR